MIGNKAYVGTGTDDVIFFNNFWAYNQATDTWTPTASLPAAARREAVAFSIGTDGFVGMGCCGAMSDFWKYNSLTNSWSSITAYPGGPTMTGIAFSIAGKGYVGMGDDGGATFSKKVFEYNPGTNTWTPKSNFPGAGRTDALGFSMNGKGYVALGDDGINPFLNDLWEYNPIGDTWTQKTNFPGGSRSTAVAFAIASTGKIYIGTGDDGTTLYSDWWEWNSATNAWAPMLNFGGGIRTDETGFAIGSIGYVALGQLGAPPEFNDLWEYAPALGINENISSVNFDIYPNPFSDKTNLRLATNLVNAHLTLYNSVGQVVRKMENINGQKIILERENLPVGIYFVRITEENKLIASEKFIVND